MRKFVQVNEDGFIFGINETAGEIKGINVIEVPFDFDPEKKRWNGTGWEETAPDPDPPLTEQEQIAIDTALNVEYMVCLMEANLG